MKNLQNLKFYSYSGFGSPELLAIGFDNLVKNLTVESNYLGDITDETVEELADWLDSFNTIEEMQEYHENVVNDIWINPTYENLKNFNLSVGLDENTYIENFKKVLTDKK